MVESRFLRPKAGFYVTKALSVGKLGKGHAAILFCAEKRLDFVIAVITLYVSVEGVPREMIHELRENQFPRIHDICLLLC